jgi:hypothetical protein
MAPVEQRRKFLFLKAVLSLGIAFHLFCIVLVPNSQNYVGYIVAPVVEPYIRTLSLASTWGFFAPDPGPPPVYIEYEALSMEGVLLRSSRWPDDTKSPFFREQRIWRVSLARSLSILPAGSEQIVGPYLCKLNPDAGMVRMWRVMYGMPSLVEVRDGKRVVGDEVDQDRRSVGLTYCKQDEVTTTHASRAGEGP